MSDDVRKASGGSIEKRRGLWFRPAEAQGLFWALVLLGIGVLAVLKGYMTERRAGSRLKGGVVPYAATISWKDGKPLPLQKELPGSVEILLTEPQAVPSVEKERNRFPAGAFPSGEKSEEFEVQLEEINTKTEP